MEVSDNTENTQINGSPKVLRLLSGVFSGCEFNIDTPRIHVLTDTEAQFSDMTGIADLPIDTLTLPGTEGCVNFELVFRQEEPETFTLRELYPDETTERQVRINQRTYAGNVVFAIREAHQSWAPDILGHVLPGKKVKRPVTAVLKRRLLWITLPVTVGLLIVFVLYTLFRDPGGTRIQELKAMLDRKQEFIFVSGRDKVTYILVTTRQKQTWVNQVVTRSNLDYPVSVIYPVQEARRIADWLTSYHPELKYFKIITDQLQKPVLLISEQRTHLSPEQQKQLTEELLKVIPYADSVSISTVSDELVTAQADKGLGTLGVRFVRYETTDCISYAIEGEINDSELVRLESFIDHFYAQWGEKYIRFHVSLRQDELKDKSFGYGRFNYTKTGPGKWIFSTP